jgi:hypothetical protein
LQRVAFTTSATGALRMIFFNTDFVLGVILGAESTARSNALIS